MTDTTLHETSQVFRWGTYVRNFELIVPKSSTFHQSIPVLQFSRPHVCSHCPLLDAVKVSVDMITWCTNSHNVHNYTCTVFHLEIVQGGMNRSEAERHELHCVHNASWVFFKKGGGGMTSPQVKAWCNSKRGYMLSLKNWISCLISWTTCANCRAADYISCITVYISCVLTTFLVCQPILSVGHAEPCTVLCCSEVFSIDTQFEKELLVSLHGGVLSAADEK